MLRWLLICIVGFACVDASFAAASDELVQALSSFGYTIKQTSVAPTAWESEQFHPTAKRVLEIKSVREVPRDPRTFYRFTVIEERYADAASAERRLARLREKPPNLSPEAEKAFPLRTGFRYGEDMYIVSTDVAMFQGEMVKLARQLQAALRDTANQ